MPLQLRSIVRASGELELSLADVPMPEPKADEVVVRIDAAPMNPSDLGLLFGGQALGWNVTGQVPIASVSSEHLLGHSAVLDVGDRAGLAAGVRPLVGSWAGLVAMPRDEAGQPSDCLGPCDVRADGPASTPAPFGVIHVQVGPTPRGAHSPTVRSASAFAQRAARRARSAAFWRSM